MSIERKVRLVEELFDQLEKNAQFEKSSGIGCEAGCGKCCSYPDIQASPLEFLPWAFDLFLNDQAQKMLEKLEQSKVMTCIIFEQLSILGKGRCSNYKHRGLICRLFGFAASTDKYGAPRLSTCNTIKEGQAEKYEAANISIKEGLPIPFFTEYYMKLNQIDFTLGNHVLHINEALKMALEEVLRYYYYRPIVDEAKNCG